MSPKHVLSGPNPLKSRELINTGTPFFPCLLSLPVPSLMSPLPGYQIFKKSVFIWQCWVLVAALRIFDISQTQLRHVRFSPPQPFTHSLKPSFNLHLIKSVNRPASK